MTSMMRMNVFASWMKFCDSIASSSRLGPIGADLLVRSITTPWSLFTLIAQMRLTCAVGLQSDKLEYLEPRATVPNSWW